VKSPEVAVVALVEHGGFGGKHAAPIAFDAVRAYLQYVRGGKTSAPPPGKPHAKGRGGSP
jgi:penicillin-binding protein 2